MNYKNFASQISFFEFIQEEFYEPDFDINSYKEEIEILKKEINIDFLTKLSFDGFAIGGSVGKTKEEMVNMLAFTLDHLPKDFPNHLLGIGDIASLNQAIPLGIDTFDSSYPTKAARHGLALTKSGSIKIMRKENQLNFSPIETECQCFTCRNYTVAYLQHLFKAKEIAALTLSSIHNLHFMVEYMKDYRSKILQDKI